MKLKSHIVFLDFHLGKTAGKPMIKYLFEKDYWGESRVERWAINFVGKSAMAMMVIGVFAFWVFIISLMVQWAFK